MAMGARAIVPTVLRLVGEGGVLSLLRSWDDGHSGAVPGTLRVPFVAEANVRFPPPRWRVSRLDPGTVRVPLRSMARGGATSGRLSVVRSSSRSAVLEACASVLPALPPCSLCVAPRAPPWPRGPSAVAAALACGRRASRPRPFRRTRLVAGHPARSAKVVFGVGL